ncbi:tripeptidyl-peptidase 1 [Limosa lapponica baueri]|uniref:Tripeptidyl-peptidase 1 n=1 Tax=Limosa lapponica baueri TaxID=1758121 RepID=A0A2I0TV58_LIMLA|nr:tripeptidyl-peptidase 1 [Limosa lapponica baueri]
MVALRGLQGHAALPGSHSVPKVAPGGEGKYLSLGEVQDLVQPSPATLMAVLKWLQGHGVESCSSVATLDFLECQMPASTAERLLPGAQFHRYVKGQRSVVRSPLPYAVPEELAEHVDFGTFCTGRGGAEAAPAAWGAGGTPGIKQPGLATSVPLGTV